MGKLARTISKGTIRLDEPNVASELACHNERKNWAASQFGLPTIGSKLVNQHGIEWVVQNHAEVPTMDSLQRWRKGQIEPRNDLYPVVAPMNLSPQLMEFFHAIDRCTTKTFAILDTMPGRRTDGHVPGGNYIDTVSNPLTNLLFLDAARVNETIIAHEFGHAWVQYVDECEDLRMVEDASDPQRMRHVNYVQSFVLDLKVNDLLRRKGFDMAPIEEDQARSMFQLAAALESGYRPEHPREEVFMALLVADQIIQRENGRSNELARFDLSLATIRHILAPLANLAEVMAESVGRHGYGSHDAIVKSIDECLIKSFEHVGDSFDLDKELTLIRPEEPDLDKVPKWLTPIPPKMKCQVGKHMARNDISSDWPYSISPGLTERTKVVFNSPEGDRRSQVLVNHRIGPPTAYYGMSEEQAEVLELRRQNEERRLRTLTPGFPDPKDPKSIHEFNERNRLRILNGMGIANHDRLQAMKGRPYMAGLGRFLTAARYADQLAGENPYGYAFSSPLTYVDPNGNSPVKPGSYAVYSPCGNCSKAILSQWYGKPAHTNDHGYAHCMACCVLNQIGGSDCALGTQTLQNLWPFGGGVLGWRAKIAKDRYDNCVDGFGIIILGHETPTQACQRGCQSYNPLPSGIQPLPYLPECDPRNYTKRQRPTPPWWVWPRPGPVWDYCPN